VTRVAFAGAEVPSSRQHLKVLGVGLVTFNWFAYKQNYAAAGTDLAVLADQLKDFDTVIESGATKIDAKGWPDHKVKQLAADYNDFVAAVWDSIYGWTEFNTAQLGPAWVANQRASFENDPKFWPVWSWEDPVEALKELAVQFTDVAILGSIMSPSLNLKDVMGGLYEDHGTRFHAMGTHSVEKIRRLPLTTLATGAWSAPGRTGALMFWDAETATIMQRPDLSNMRMRARVNRAAVEAGCAAQAVISGDWEERTRLAVWSVQMLERHLNGGAGVTDAAGNLSDNSDRGLPTTSAELVGGGSTNSDLATRNLSDVRPMPILGFERRPISEIDEEGNEILSEGTFVTSSPLSVRQCNNCVVSAYCPASKPNSMCSLSVPVEVRTKDQLQQLLDALLEMQAQRIAFGRYAEELAGGMPDPGTSKEIDRLYRMLKTTKHLQEQPTDKLQITLEQQAGSAGPGVLSAIFGDRASVLRELPNGGLGESQTDSLLRQISELESPPDD
jgi:hypothetical protein